MFILEVYNSVGRSYLMTDSYVALSPMPNSWSNITEVTQYMKLREREDI